MKRFILLMLFTLMAFIIFAQEDLPLITVMDFEANEISLMEVRIFSDFLSTHIHETGKYRIIDRTQRETILKELAFSLSGCVDEKCQIEAGRMLQAKHIVVGSLGKIGSRYLLNMKMIDLSTSETVKTVSSQYPDLDALLDDSRRLTHSLLEFKAAPEAQPAVSVQQKPEQPKQEPPRQEQPRQEQPRPVQVVPEKERQVQPSPAEDEYKSFLKIYTTTRYYYASVVGGYDYRINQIAGLNLYFWLCELSLQYTQPLSSLSAAGVLYFDQSISYKPWPWLELKLRNNLRYQTETQDVFDFMYFSSVFRYWIFNAEVLARLFFYGYDSFFNTYDKYVTTYIGAEGSLLRGLDLAGGIKMIHLSGFDSNLYPRISLVYRFNNRFALEGVIEGFVDLEGVSESRFRLNNAELKLSYLF